MQTRRLLMSACLASVLALPALSQTLTVPTTIRIGSPDAGTGGKSSSGSNVLTIVQHNQWLEQEFAKEGIKVEWIFFRGGGPAVGEALAAKQLDIVYLGDLASVIHRAHGLTTRYLMPAARGTNSYLATAPGVEISTISDLKGRRVSVLKGTAFQRPFDKLLASAGMTEKDLKLLNLDYPSAKAALVAKQIDATFGGADLFLLKEKGVNLPISTKGRDSGFTINAGILGTDEFITKYPHITARMVKQLVRASHWASQESNREALIKLIVNSSGMSDLSVRFELENENLKVRFSPLIDDALLADYQGVVDDGLKLGLIRKGFDVKAWMAPAFVQQAVRELKP